MQEWIIQTMNQFGYIGIMLLIAVENIFPPIPSEVILTFGGFLTTYTDMKVWGVVLAATVGAVIGALVLYSIGRFFPPERIEGWLDGRLGQILHFKRQDVERAAQWFQKKGRITVFVCRFIPIIRSLISIPAGMTKMSMGVFLLYTAAGTFLWNTVLVHLGAFAGESWESVAQFINLYAHATLIILIVLFIVGAIFFYKTRISKKNNKENV
ncbi:DedA family protein [Faecalispora anaeroviscerum]|uniref:DedA family protein n=1 Tax=Faecalispora anaeroviscerum TaxID=2991836 RepID=UPI0024B9D2EF|nr:DedA family protein [Faecalispora anaeroviscerum]